jgi:hypothetical protein
MTTNLNTQVHDPAAIEKTENKLPQMISILDEANLDAVNGGANVVDGVARATLGFLLNHAVVDYMVGEAMRDVQQCR